MGKSTPNQNVNARNLTQFVQIAGHGKVWPLFQISRVEVVANSNIMLVRLSGTDFEGNFTEENFRGGQCYINFDLITAGTIRVPSGYFYVKSIQSTDGLAPYNLEIWLSEPSAISDIVDVTSLSNDPRSACFFRMEEFFRACTTRPEWVTGLISREMYIENIVDFTDTVGQKLEYRGGISSVDGLTITHTYGGGQRGGNTSIPQPPTFGSENFFDSFVRWDRLFWRAQVEVLRDQANGIDAYYIEDLIPIEGDAVVGIGGAQGPAGVALRNWDTLIFAEEVVQILDPSGNPDIGTVTSWDSIRIPGDPPTGSGSTALLYGVTEDSRNKFRGLLKTQIEFAPQQSRIIGHFVREGIQNGSGETYVGYHTAIGKRAEVYIAELDEEPNHNWFDAFYFGFVDGNYSQQDTTSYQIGITSNLLWASRKTTESTTTDLRQVRNDGIGDPTRYFRDTTLTNFGELDLSSVNNWQQTSLADYSSDSKTNIFRWVKYGDDFLLPVQKVDITLSGEDESQYGLSTFYVYGTKPEYNRMNIPTFAVPNDNMIRYFELYRTEPTLDDIFETKRNPLCNQFIFAADQSDSDKIKSALFATVNKIDGDPAEFCVIKRGRKGGTNSTNTARHKRFAVDTYVLANKHGNPSPIVVAERSVPDPVETNTINLFNYYGKYRSTYDRIDPIAEKYGIENFRPYYRRVSAENEIPSQVIICSPIEFLLQILTSTGTGRHEKPGTNRAFWFDSRNAETKVYSFDVLPKKMGFAIPLERIDIESFLEIAEKFGEDESTFLCNEFVETSADLKKYVEEKLLQPYFLGLVTNESGKLTLVDLTEQNGISRTILVEDLEFGSLPSVGRDVTRLANAVYYTGKNYFKPIWKGKSEFRVVRPGDPPVALLKSFVPTDFIYNYNLNVLGFGVTGGVNNMFSNINKSPIKIELPRVVYSPTSGATTTNYAESELGRRAARFIALYNSPILVLRVTLNSSRRYEIGRYYGLELNGVPGADGRASLNERGLLIDVQSNLRSGSQEATFLISINELLVFSALWSPFAELETVDSSTEFNIGFLDNPAANWLPNSNIGSADFATWTQTQLFTEDDLVVLYDENFVLKSTDGPVAIDSYDLDTGEIVLKSAWTASSSPITPSPGDVIALADIDTVGQTDHARGWAFMDRPVIFVGPQKWR